MSEKRDAILEGIKGKLDSWNAQIDALAEKKDQASAETRKIYHEKVQYLKAKKIELEQRLAEARGSSADAWHDLRTGLEGAASTLGSALKSAAFRFAKSGPETRIEDEAAAELDHPAALAENQARDAQALAHAGKAGASGQVPPRL